MPEEKKRRKKVVGEATHRTGEYRAAVKPGSTQAANTTASTTANTNASANSSAQASSHAAAAAASAQAAQVDPIKQFIESYMAKLPTGTLSQAVWGDALAAQAASAKKIFGLAADDEPYFFLSLTNTSKGQGGILLSKSGFHIRDGQGDSADVPWKDFTRITISLQGTNLLIGTVGLQLQDGKALGSLLVQIQKLIGK